MRGVPLPVVQEFTGHTSVHVLNIYKHLAPDHLRQQVEHIYGEKKK
jgi:site-specific recombinase XerD